MVDVAVNHAASVSSDISNSAFEKAAGGKLLFKKSENYHTPCPMNYGAGETDQMLQQCWFVIGDEGKNDVSLMDLKTESAGVADVLNAWVGPWVKKFGIDGLRLDASKHMDLAFQHNLCAAAGVFCAGEVPGEDVGYVLLIQDMGYAKESGISPSGLVQKVSMQFLDSVSPSLLLQLIADTQACLMDSAKPSVDQVPRPCHTSRK